MWYTDDATVLFFYPHVMVLSNYLTDVLLSLFVSNIIGLRFIQVLLNSFEKYIIINVFTINQTTANTTPTHDTFYNPIPFVLLERLFSNVSASHGLTQVSE